MVLIGGQYHSVLYLGVTFLISHYHSIWVHVYLLSISTFLLSPISQCVTRGVTIIISPNPLLANNTMSHHIVASKIATGGK